METAKRKQKQFTKIIDDLQPWIFLCIMESGRLALALPEPAVTIVCPAAYDYRMQKIFRKALTNSSLLYIVLIS